MQLRSHLFAIFSALKQKDQASYVSVYQPTDAEKTRLAAIQRDFHRADLVRNKAYEEFNNLTLIQTLDRDRKAFNSYVPPASEDPDESWRAYTVRPVTRNKVISIAAHVTSSLLYPQIFAQNDNDAEDKEAALVMRDLVEWTNEQGGYAINFVKAVVKALVDPVTIFEEGYAEVFRKIKDIQADGSWKDKEVLDEIYSGFINSIVPCEELYIANAYESNIQKQAFLIRQRFIEVDEAKEKYQSSSNWKYVTPGITVFFDEATDGFYQMKDDNISESLVEETTYYNRYADVELRLINGILMDDPDRPLQRKDKAYGFAKTGYEFFGGTDFFYYKSLVSKMSSDQEIIDTLYNMIIDGSFLQVMPPGVISGDEEFDASIMIPGGITIMNEESKFQTVNTNNNLSAGMNALQMVERSASESSADRLSQGMSSDSTPATAYEISRLETNARTMLGLFGKMIAEFVEEFGKLRVGTILQHMTVAQGSEITGGVTRLKYRQFLMPSGKEGKKTKKIMFDMTLPEDEEGQMKKSFELQKEERRSGSKIAVVNPELFRRNKYLFRVKADFMPEQSEAVKKSLNLEAYDRAIQNPILDQEKVTSEFLLESYRPGEADKFVKKASPMQAGMQIPGGNSNMTSQILNKAEAKAVK
jgi:hypothetical protein